MTRRGHEIRNENDNSIPLLIGSVFVPCRVFSKHGFKNNTIRIVLVNNDRLELPYILAHQSYRDWPTSTVILM